MLEYILLAYSVLGLVFTIYGVAKSKFIAFDWIFILSIIISLIFWPVIYGISLYFEFKDKR